MIFQYFTQRRALIERTLECTSKSLVRLEANVYSMKNKTCANIGYAKKLNGYTDIWIYAQYETSKSMTIFYKEKKLTALEYELKLESMQYFNENIRNEMQWKIVENSATRIPAVTEYVAYGALVNLYQTHIFTSKIMKLQTKSTWISINLIKFLQSFIGQSSDEDFTREQQALKFFKYTHV